MGRLFGTDGVRGLANGHLTAELALDLAVSAAHILTERGDFAGRRPFAVVGTDTRASGEFLSAAVISGLASAGVDVLMLGDLPTPGVAFLTASLGADLGVMLSASHNPMPDNGIKFLARGGKKLDDSLEDAIEARMSEPWERPTGAGVGRVRRHRTAIHDYATHLNQTVEQSFEGLKVVVDCANGAASVVAPQVLRAAGAEVVAICHQPDGLNINDGCGSTHLEVLQEAVREHGADVGFALDGDADRCLAVDAEGRVVDGDQIIAMLAIALRDRGELAEDSVVVTVMSNLGFNLAMKHAGINVVSTGVGDRYVLEAMTRGSLSLGGEQSGHVIMSAHATTGDGTLTMLQVLNQMAATGKSVAELGAVMSRLPQVLVNVPGVDKARAAIDPGLLSAVAREESLLGESGRVLLRPSGTEPLVRVMVEAPTQERAEEVAARLAGVVRERLAI